MPGVSDPTPTHPHEVAATPIRLQELEDQVHSVKCMRQNQDIEYHDGCMVNRLHIRSLLGVLREDSSEMGAIFS